MRCALVHRELKLYGLMTPFRSRYEVLRKEGHDHRFSSLTNSTLSRPKMNTQKSLGIGLLLALLIAITWILNSNSVRPSEAAIAQFERNGSEIQQSLKIAPISRSGTERGTLHRTQTPTPSIDPEIVLDQTQTTIAVRVRDHNGSAIDGATLKVSGTTDSGTSVYGEARLVVALSESIETTQLQLELSCPGFATSSRMIVCRSGEMSWLEDWVLIPAGSVAGQVSDSFGVGVENAALIYLLQNAQPEPFAHHRKRSIEFWPNAPAQIRSGPAGTFQFDEVPTGTARLFAFANGKLVARSRSFELQPGQTIRGVDVVFEMEQHLTGVSGQVLSPTGDPIPYADLELVTAQSTRHQLTSDAAGRFDFRTDANQIFALVARDPRGLFDATKKIDVPSGSTEVELVLGEANPLQASVATTDGVPIQEFTLDVLFLSPRTLHRQYRSRSANSIASKGVVSISKPNDSFEVELSSPGYRTQVFGPFQPERCENPLVFKLDRSPGLRGRVMTDDSPSGGTRISLHRRLNERTLLNGFDVRMDIREQAFTTTDAEGEYELPVGEAGEYFVIAVHPHWPSAEIGPFDLGLTADTRGDFTLEPGAILEVHVTATDGADASGAIVGISRGDGRAQSRRTDSEGLAVFANLAAGPWVVRLLDEELIDGMVHIQTMPGPVVNPDSSVDLLAGSKTRFELPLAKSESKRCELRGKLRVNGTGAEGWITQLHSRDNGLVHSAPTSKFGKFLLASEVSGEFDLLLLNMSANGITVIKDSVSLVNSISSWQSKLETGSIAGRISNPAPSGSTYFFTCRGSGEVRYFASLTADQSGEFSRDLVPTGAGQIVLLQTDRPLHEQSPVALLEIEVTRDQVTEVEVQ
ncbi:MAG: hypothetical protein ACI8TQ_000557 [Planctomycetota bacterium]|jgi:hypothetical protein